MSARITLTDDHRYVCDGRHIPGVSEILQGSGVVDFSCYPEWAKDRGTAVHLACELDDLGELDDGSVAPDLAGYLAAWRAWRRDTRPQWRAIEEIVYSATYDYAGRIDRVAAMNGTTYVIEIKSGGLQRFWGIQLAAYALAYAGHDFLSVRRMAVQLRRDGQYRVHVFQDARDFDVFFAALALFRWRVGGEK